MKQQFLLFFLRVSGLLLLSFWTLAEVWAESTPSSPLSGPAFNNLEDSKTPQESFRKQEIIDQESSKTPQESFRKQELMDQKSSKSPAELAPGTSIISPNFTIDPRGFSPSGIQYNKGTKGNIQGLLTAFSRLLLILIGLFAVVLIIVGGIRMAISGGNSDEVSKGTYMIKYNIYAIVLSLSSYIIIQLVTWILQ